MQPTETRLDLSAFSDADLEAIQRQSVEWGLSFDDTCLRMLLELARTRRAERTEAEPGLFSRLFGYRTAH